MRRDQLHIFDWDDPSPVHRGSEIIADPALVSSFWALPADPLYYWQSDNS